MKTVKDACKLQPNALEINVGDQIEQLDELINKEDGSTYFAKTFITEGMRTLLEKGIARLAGKSSSSIFHLKQAMGGGKTHLLVAFGLLVKNKSLRQKHIAYVNHHASFNTAKVAAFNGRNYPDTFFWGEIAEQLGKGELFKKYWESGPKAPDEKAWLSVFESSEPVLILLDELPPYFHNYNTQQLGKGTVADVVTTSFANMLVAAQKKSNVCIVISDLEAAYDSGGKLIQKSLNDASQELGRAEVNITPVNLESNEVYEILRKRLFLSLPDKSEIADIASAYSKCLKEASKAKTVSKSAELIAEEIENTYPFHPSFKNIVALFKGNEKFKQTRGLMELVSRLLKSVWQKNGNSVFLIGAQHFDLSDNDVRDKLAEISDMREVISKDLWDSNNSAHAQEIDIQSGKNTAAQLGSLLLTSSLSTAVNAVKGLTEHEVIEYLIDPLQQSSDFKAPFEELKNAAWYLHETSEGKHYFDRQENLTKKLQGYAEKAPENKVNELIEHRLTEMYKPSTKEAYDKVLPLPEMDAAGDALKYGRALLIISPDGKTPPQIVENFYQSINNKNNILVLTGEKSQMASIEKAARHVYAAMKTDKELPSSHPQRKELDEKMVQYNQDFQATVLSVFDKIFYPRQNAGKDILQGKALDQTYPSNEEYSGEKQVIKTLCSDPIKLYVDIKDNYDAIKSKAETLVFGNQADIRKPDFQDKMKQLTQMPWLPPKGLDELIQTAYQRGEWEDLGGNLITKKPRAKKTDIIITVISEQDDKGFMRLRIETVHAGNMPKIHYAEDASVNENSPLLKENELSTNALRVQFLAVDPTGQNTTGEPKIWENHITIRCSLDEATRELTLMAAPKGEIKYTLDGTEPRNGTLYTKPFAIGNEEIKVLAFAEFDGLVSKREFSFNAIGSKKLTIVKEKNAEYSSKFPSKIDGSGPIWQALEFAKEKNVTFDEVSLTLNGLSDKVITLSIGKLNLNASQIEETFKNLQSLIDDNNANVIFKFKRAFFQTGFDLESFAKSFNIDLNNGEIIQS